MPSHAIRGTSSRAMRSLCGARTASATHSSANAIAERISDRCVGETPVVEELARQRAVEREERRGHGGEGIAEAVTGAHRGIVQQPGRC